MNRNIATSIALIAGTAGSAIAQNPMMESVNGYRIFSPIFNVGESFGDYSPPGILDGMGAYQLDENTVRLLANHELLHFRGYPYEVNDGMGGTFSMVGARVSYFDIDISTRQIVASGLAYDTVYDANGNIASDLSFQPTPYAPFFGGPDDAAPLAGFSRFCSSAVIEPMQFDGQRGLAERIYLTGEEDGGGFNSVGGAEWALDPASGAIWHLPDLGRGAWENVCELDTGNTDQVAILLSDDSSPYDHDADGTDEAAPLYLYIGNKDANGDYPARNGLRGGTLYVWVADNGELSPVDFNTSGTISGSWVAVDNARDMSQASGNGVTGYGPFGYPTQGNLWIQAESLGAFGFSRPEDVATNPSDGTEAVLASTGVDTFVGGVDTFGTMYTIKTDFNDLTADLTIIYDGDADPTRALRSPDNLDWADDGLIYVQEDEAEEDTLDGEVLFGDGAVNPNEAGIVQLDPSDGSIKRIANIDRSVILDMSIANPFNAVDVDAGAAGEWESSGIIDVSSLFGEDPGELFLINIQAHGIEDQDDFNPTSRINDGDLVEGGQLLFIGAPLAEDIDLNGQIDFFDFSIMMTNFGATGENIADLNGDGEVNIDDVSILLDAFAKQ